MQIINPGKQRIWNGLSGSALKMIAMLLMFIDHAGVALYQNNRQMGIIGRSAFPIFVFLLVEGFTYTHDRRKYAFRLALFALLSELPFNLLSTGSLWDISFRKQNVMFTLLFGFLTIWTLEEIRNEKINAGMQMSASLLVSIAGAAAAFFCHTDYSMYGVMAIVVMYCLRGNRILEMFGGCLVLCCMEGTEPYCLFSLLPVLFYNGKKGYSMKYLFYAFYPLHMLLLYVLSVF